MVTVLKLPWLTLHSLFGAVYGSNKTGFGTISCNASNTKTKHVLSHLFSPEQVANNIDPDVTHTSHMRARIHSSDWSEKLLLLADWPRALLSTTNYNNSELRTLR